MNNIITYNLFKHIQRLQSDLTHILSIKDYSIEEALKTNDMIISNIKVYDHIMSKPISNTSADNYINMSVMAEAIENCIIKYPETKDYFLSHGITIREEV